MANLRKVERVFWPWHEWECYKAGFYETAPPPGVSADHARQLYSVFLRDTKRFRKAILKVFRKWPRSCEHFLTDPHINRIAWLGQASVCIETKVPSAFRGGFFLLTPAERDAANEVARQALVEWLNARKN